MEVDYKEQIMNMLKGLLGVTEDEDMKVIDIYIERSIDSIRNYLNNPKITREFIMKEYGTAIIAIVENAYYYKGKNGKIKSKTQGNRSVTYFNNTSFIVTDDIALLLPTPFVKLS